jgi:hypothetical protein
MIQTKQDKNMKLNKFKVEKLSTTLLQSVTGGKQKFETASHTSSRFTSTTATDNDSHSHDVD